MVFSHVYINEIKWCICPLLPVPPARLHRENTWPANQWISVQSKWQDQKFKKQSDKNPRESKIHKSCWLQESLKGHPFQWQLIIYPTFERSHVSNLPRYLSAIQSCHVIWEKHNWLFFVLHNAFFFSNITKYFSSFLKYTNVQVQRTSTHDICACMYNTGTQDIHKHTDM